MDIKYLYENTELTIQEIANQLKIHRDTVSKYIKRYYSSEFRKTRKSICYRNSKQGIKNPMFGKYGESHHNYVGIVGDSKGYLMVLKPSWYTGRKGSKHVFLHSVIMCEFLELTEVPRGWCIHHCDFNPHNNNIDNLVLLTVLDHMKLHQSVLKGATTISKESTLKWVETYGTLWRNDIVCSA